jgi:hypothetical protein
MTSFVSVSTGAARIQDLTLNPQKLAGQCAKLKCCMNFEVDAYAEAMRRFPARDVQLETAEGTWYFFKADILRRLVTYSTERGSADNLVTITARRAFDIIALNREGKRPESLSEDGAIVTGPGTGDLLEQDSLTRFDRKKKKKNKNRRDRERTASPKASTEEGENSSSNS